jgi:hypothetical protein
MAFLNPSIGDLWDRALVLDLKIMHGWAQGKDVSHFRQELSDIQRITIKSLGNKDLGKILRELRNVHERLWDATSLQWEAKDDASPFFLAWLAKETRDLNRKRTELKEQIEKLFNEWKGQDKI